jgi:hypothetical protein
MTVDGGNKGLSNNKLSILSGRGWQRCCVVPRLYSPAIRRCGMPCIASSDDRHNGQFIIRESLTRIFHKLHEPSLVF